MSHTRLLGGGLVVLIASDVLLARAAGLPGLLAGVALWGIHMGMTQGLLAAMVADTAPAPLRGTAYGVFNLASGLAMLLASVVAGGLWDAFGPGATFWAGAGFAQPAAAGVAPGSGPPSTPNSTGVLVKKTSAWAAVRAWASRVHSSSVTTSVTSMGWSDSSKKWAECRRPSRPMPSVPTLSVAPRMPSCRAVSISHAPMGW
jgi:MFS family permease